MERLLFAQLTLAKPFKTSVLEFVSPYVKEDFQVPKEDSRITIRSSAVYHFSGTAFFQDDLSF